MPCTWDMRALAGLAGLGRKSGAALGAAMSDYAKVFDVQVKIIERGDTIERALERFKDYLERRGWTRLPSGIISQTVECPTGFLGRSKADKAAGDRCVRRTFRVGTLDSKATLQDAKVLVSEALFSTGVLGHAVEQASLAYDSAYDKLKKGIEDVGDKARGLRCAAIEAATGFPCWAVYGGVIALGIGTIAVIYSPVIVPLLTPRGR